MICQIMMLTTGGHLMEEIKQIQENQLHSFECSFILPTFLVKKLKLFLGTVYSFLQYYQALITSFEMRI